MSITNKKIVEYLDLNGTMEGNEFESLLQVLSDVHKKACSIACYNEDEFQACLKLSALSLIMAGFLAVDSQAQSRCLAVAKDIIKINDI